MSSAKPLKANASSGCCYQGQTHGHAGFLLPADEARKMLAKHPAYSTVLKPFLTADELIGNLGSQPKRYVIDFREHDIFSAKSFDDLYSTIKAKVYPDKERKAQDEKNKNDETLKKSPKAKINNDHQSAFKTWWKLFRSRDELLSSISNCNRYIACGRVTKRPIFEFISSDINPNDALQVFPLTDDYSFGILQSVVHWEWFVARCSTLKGDFRYTSNSVFDTFPWPQKPNKKQITDVAQKAAELRSTRREVIDKHQWSLRELYRVMEETPENPVSKAQDKLDAAVFTAYGMKKDEDILSFLLALNGQLAEAEAAGKPIIGPGLPSTAAPDTFMTDDCVRVL